MCLAVTVLNPRIATLYLECSRSDKVDTWWGMLSVRVRVRFRVRVRVRIRRGQGTSYDFTLHVLG